MASPNAENESQEKTKKGRKQDVILDFVDELGDMSPIDGLRGPKTPSSPENVQHA